MWRSFVERFGCARHVMRMMPIDLPETSIRFLATRIDFVTELNVVYFVNGLNGNRCKEASCQLWSSIELLIRRTTTRIRCQICYKHQLVWQSSKSKEQCTHRDQTVTAHHKKLADWSFLIIHKIKMFLLKANGWTVFICMLDNIRDWLERWRSYRSLSCSCEELQHKLLTFHEWTVRLKLLMSWTLQLLFDTKYCFQVGPNLLGCEMVSLPSAIFLPIIAEIWIWHDHYNVR